MNPALHNSSSSASSLRAQRLQRFIASDIYPVTSTELSAGRSSLQILDALLDGGARVVQLREKSMPKRALYALARQFRQRCREAGALLMINDHLDIALAVDADGVHLGQEDLPIEVARNLAPDLLLGSSTHNLAELQAAQAAGADLVNLGPVFVTQTKIHHYHLGLEGISALIPHCQVPFSVMGGIKVQHIPDLLALGVRHIAVVTAITAAADPAQATRDLIAAMHPRASL